MPSPIVSATIQAAGLSTVSNILAQMIEAYRAREALVFNFAQLLRFILLTLLTAPPNYHWQQFLERTFPAYAGSQSGVDTRGKEDTELKSMEAGEAAPPVQVGGTGAQGEGQKLNMRNTLTKWFVDCITMGAIMNTLAFLVLMGIMKGQPFSLIWYNIKMETIPIIIAGYKIWPIASIISFSFIPVHRRIVFLSFIGLLWGIYMSMVAARV